MQHVAERELNLVFIAKAINTLDFSLYYSVATFEYSKTNITNFNKIQLRLVFYFN